MRIVLSQGVVVLPLLFVGWLVQQHVVYSVRISDYSSFLREIAFQFNTIVARKDA